MGELKEGVKVGSEEKLDFILQAEAMIFLQTSVVRVRHRASNVLPLPPSLVDQSLNRDQRLSVGLCSTVLKT